MEYDALPENKVVEKTMESLKTRGVNVEFVTTGEDAFKKLKDLIPAGAELMTASSTGYLQFSSCGAKKTKKKY